MCTKSPTSVTPGSPRGRTDVNLSQDSSRLPERPHHADMQFAEAMVESSIRDGQAVPAFPEGSREEVVSLLTGLMVDRERLDAYAASLRAEQERRDVRLSMLQSDGLDIPDARIAAEGFGGLSDDHLADIALSPEAVEAIRDYLDDPATEPGAWFIDAVLEAEARRPDAAEQARRAVEIFRRLKDEGELP